MRSESAALLWDALIAAQVIADFTAGISLVDYENDLLRRRAVEREFEIIGEALGRLRRDDPQTATRIPGLAEAVGMRNILIHGYAAIDDARVYDTAVLNIPDLITVLATLMEEAKELRDHNTRTSETDDEVAPTQVTASATPTDSR